MELLGELNNPSELKYDRVITKKVDTEWLGYNRDIIHIMTLPCGIWDLEFDLTEYNWGNQQSYYSPFVGMSTGSETRIFDYAGLNPSRDLWYRGDEGRNGYGSPVSYQHSYQYFVRHKPSNNLSGTSASSIFPLHQVIGAVVRRSTEYLVMHDHTHSSTASTLNVVNIRGNVTARRRAYTDIIS